MLGNSLIKEIQLRFDRELDEKLYNYLQSFCSLAHFKIDVKKFKETVPNWKDYTFFGCTGPDGEFIIWNSEGHLPISNISEFYQTDKNGEYITIGENKHCYLPIRMKNKQEIESGSWATDFVETKKWLEYIIKNFLETAPEPYFLTGKIELEEFRGKFKGIKRSIQVKNNKISYSGICSGIK